MSKIQAICIDRQYASGGSDIGKLVAEKLGIKCYDHELVDMAIAKCDATPEEFKKYEEAVLSPLHTPLSFKMGLNRQLDMTEKIFAAETEIITEIARAQQCVIVGRCADYILKNMVPTLNLYIYSDIEKRMDCAMSKHNVSADEVDNIIRKYDKKRADYYNTNTTKHWGDKASYDLCLNSGKLGYELCAEIIADIVRNS